jgi:hypothetical protein
MGHVAGFRDRDEREVLVRPAAPRPFVATGHHAESAEGLIVCSTRQETVGDVAQWHIDVAGYTLDADGGDDTLAARPFNNLSYVVNRFRISEACLRICLIVLRFKLLSSQQILSLYSSYALNCLSRS